MTNSDIQEILGKYNNDRFRLMDILLDIQDKYGYIPKKFFNLIGQAVGLSSAKVEETVTFYHFFHTSPKGKYTIYLNDGIVATMKGRDNILKQFSEQTGCQINSVSKDEKFGLFSTPCIGMSDQEPAAIINKHIFTNLTVEKVNRIVRLMKKDTPIQKIIQTIYESDKVQNLIHTMVTDNIKKTGSVLLNKYKRGSAVKKSLNKNPEEILEEIKNSNLRGRGGAGFPTGTKWEFCTKSKQKPKFIVCNADEGEPGTFKDRVLLTNYPELLFDGMIIAGYTLGAEHGIIYLRYEYSYLKNFLQSKLEQYKKENLLGKKIVNSDFNFDIRIQLGAGSYVCGEETALIESMEGKRGEPRNRPPFPASCGYVNKPTTVNNVETLSCVPKIINHGSEWFKSFGTEESAGTKLLSICGDCGNSGVFEIEFGMTINEMLEMADTIETQAVVVAGPSGKIISENEFNRKICFEDLATAGAMIIIGKQRNLLEEVVPNFLDFFIDESCGSCTPCRVITTHAKNRLKKILAGKGTTKDLKDIKSWGNLMQKSNRCGLGKTALNPLLTTIKFFPELYERLIKDKEYISEFNLEKATADYEKITK
ncbi:hypothetical protein GF362_01160 [Candidatus Dojkabacteria bacterium]|nr:hypothetical protein [Candidatus Dojkabacteria bacterium]